MKKNLYLSIFILFLVFSTLACGIVGGDDVSPVDPTGLPESKPAAASTEIPKTPIISSKTKPADATETPDQSTNFEIPLGDEYRSLEGGFSFRSFPDYTLDEAFGFVTLIAPDGDPNIGPAIIMIGEVTNESTTLDELYETQIVEYSEDGIDLSEPQDIRIGGALGRVVDISGTSDGEEIAGQIAIILVSPTQQFTLIAASPAERWDLFESDLEAIQATLNFFEPVFDTGELTSHEVFDEWLGDEYTTSDGMVTFKVVKDFKIEESDGNIMMISIEGNDQTGPGIYLDWGIGDREMDLDEAYENFVSNFPSNIKLSAARDEMIGGAMGRTIDIRNEDGSKNVVAGRVSVVLVNPTTTLMIGGIAPTDQWDGFITILEAVKDSVTINVPIVSSGDQQELPDGYYRSEGDYALIPPKDYSLEDSDGQMMMFAPGADPQYGPGFFIYHLNDEREINLDEILNENLPTEVDVTSGPDDISVGGLPGRVVELGGVEREVEMAGKQIIVLVEPGRYLVLIAASPFDQWDNFSPVAEDVIASLLFLDDQGRPMSSGTESGSGDEISQWAKFAFASSEYGNPDWAASQSTGEPDTSIEVCEDLPTAWASAGSDTVEWLELQYETPVIPTQINIIQTHSPDQVVKVELVDMTGAFHEIYTGTPENLWEECPYTLSVPVDVGYGVIGLRITIDQSVIPTTWNEIDAVELVGFEMAK